MSPFAVKEAGNDAEPALVMKEAVASTRCHLCSSHEPHDRGCHVQDKESKEVASILSLKSIGWSSEHEGWNNDAEHDGKEDGRQEAK